MIRSSNPALSATMFQGLPVVESNAMTIGGTVNSTMILLLLLVASAAYVWHQAAVNAAQSIGLMWGGLIVGFILAMVTIFKKEWAPVTAPVYALAEGLALGGLSAFLERMYSGIVLQAVALTFGVMFCMLAAYRSGLIKPTEKFKLGVVAATGAIVLVYVVNMIMGFFGAQITPLYQSTPLGIGISVVIVIIAALNLIIDFDVIETGAAQGAPKYMEWYGAFSLMVTLVWLYIEILNLLSKLRSRN